MNTDTPDTPNADGLDDVRDSHGMTANEEAEIAAIKAEAEGTSPAEEPAPAAPAAPTAEADDPAPAATATDPDPAPAAAVDTATPDVAVAAAPVAPALLPVPAAPKDFDAAKAELRKQYDDGDLSQDELTDKLVELGEEKAAWVAQKNTIEQINAQRQAEALAADPNTFENVQARWVTQHADFMANPIRAKAMQDAVVLIDTQTGGKLSSQELLEKASKVAFEAYNYTPPTPAKPGKTAAETARETLEARRPPVDKVPDTIARVPTSTSTEDLGRFGDLDSAAIPDMERAIAGMRPEEVEKFLLEADNQ